jgi:signal transduction histidine kinase
MSPDVLQVVVVPVCFLLAGALGLRLGTPRTVALAVALVGTCHLAAIGLAGAALASDGPARSVAHVTSQMVFAGGFAALVWAARAYPLGHSPGRVVAVAGGLAVLGPLLAGLAGPTHGVLEAPAAGPLLHLLPSAVAVVADVALAAIALLAVVVFVWRFVAAPAEVRPMMWWPVLGVGLIGFLAAAGVLLGAAFPAAGEVVFLLAAPVLPLSLTLGPVRRRLLVLTHETSRLSAALAARVTELEESRCRLSVAAEDERRRIERDLHDGAQQELLALIARIEVARERQPAAELDQVATLARGAYETVRRVSHGIRPAVLDDVGLPGALREVTESMPLPASVEVDEPACRRYAAAVEGAAYFFVCEALTNVLKHAGASRVVVRLADPGTGLRVSVEDDGRGGIDPTGAGVRGLCDRVEAVGGRVEISTRSGRSRLLAAFPGEIRA